jgi:hypothetical protein
MVPFGENIETSRKGIYQIDDPCYRFWYRFVAPMVADIEAGAGSLVAKAVTQNNLDEFLGHAFEEVCKEWLLCQAINEALPLPAVSVGSWWGTDPVAKHQTDIDVLAVDPAGKRLLIGECKYRNSFDETAEVEKLLAKANLIKGYKAEWFYFFSKNPMSKASQKKLGSHPNVCLITLNDIYKS